MRLEQAISELKSMANPENVKGMARFGISPEGTLGIPVPNLRKMAKKIGRDHGLAEELWRSGIHEGRMLAGFIDDPKLVTKEQMDRWAKDFDSWDVCDQVCCNLFDRTPFAFEKAAEWSKRDEEFVKRAGFALMAGLAWHNKDAPDEEFKSLLPLIRSGSTDERNFVKKSVNWALRQIGKRNLKLNEAAIETAEEISRLNSRSARWIAGDALRELKNEKVRRRLAEEAAK